MTRFGWISLSIAVAWVALRSDGSLGSWLIGLALGVVVAVLGGSPAVASRLSFRMGAALVRLVVGFVWEMVLSNLTQLRLILSPRLEIRPCWLRFNSRLQSPAARAALGVLISMTPGTITCSLDEDGPGSFCIHALDERDEAQTIARIRRLFEAPLLVLEGAEVTS